MAETASNVGEVETVLAELVETTPAETAPNDRSKVCFRKKKSKKGVDWPTPKILCEKNMLSAMQRTYAKFWACNIRQPNTRHPN